MNKPVAIVGFAFRLPGASGPELWDSLKAGKDLVTEVPDERWSKPSFFHPDKAESGRSYTFAAGTLGDISGFDAGFFGISPREAMQMDPQQRLLLEMTWEAFESGGIQPSALRGSQTAVYVGYSGSDYSYRRADDLSVIDASSMTGNTGSVAANRISYWFDLHGPSMAVDTACSSSLVAFHQAWQAIQVGEVNQAVVAGVSLHLHPMPFVGFSKASMLSPRGRCRVFDADGDGYVRSEGGGVFLLKALDQAEADGDQIFAVVAGVGSNCDGRTSSITIPSRDAQADLLRSVYERADIAADDVDYVEAHGTGTAVGDPIEASSIAEVFGKNRDKKNPLPIGSVKSNLGHLETASGVAGLVKALYCLQRRQVPASLHFKTPNPNIPLDDWNLKVVTENTALPASGTLTIGVNSFGFGGANAHVVLRSYQQLDKATPSHTANTLPPPLLLSASTGTALRELARGYADFLRSAERVDHYDLAYNAFHRRELMAQRLLLPTGAADRLVRMLDDYAAGDLAPGAVEGEAFSEPSAPVFVFSGNGSQWAGMGQVLLAHDPEFAAKVAEVDRLLQALGGDSVIDAINSQPSEDRYALTEIAQPALFAIQVGITEVLRRHGIEPAAVVGHSVGEVAAAWACGALNLEQAVLVIHSRSQAQGQTRGSGAMTAVALSNEDATAILDEFLLSQEVTVAGINSPRGLTVAGDPAALKRLEDVLDEREVFHRRLPLDYAFHSPAMDPIESVILRDLADLAPVAAGTFYSTVTGDILSGAGLTADYWWQNIREPVQFRAAVDALIERGFNLFVEIGPHPVLRNYLLDTLRANKVDGRVIETLLRADERASRLDEAVGKVLLTAPHDVWARFFTGQASFLDLPRYPWQRESFWPMPSPESHDNLHSEQVHPLLGYRLRGEPLAWEGQLDLRLQPALADHQVGNSVLFPAAGFAELALAAAQQREAADSYVIADLEIHAPLVLEADTARRVRLRCDAGDGRFEISSNNRMSDEPWLHHAVGRLVPGEARPARSRELKLPTRPYDFSSETHYDLTRRVGLDYGDAYQVIDGVWRDGDRLTAKLRMPSPKQDYSGFLLAPPFLDGAFQVLADHSAEGILRGESDAHVPIRIDSLQLWQPGRIPGFVSGQLVRRSQRSALIDIELYDEQFKPIASLKGVRFRRVQLVRENDNRHWLGYRLVARPRATPETELDTVPFKALVESCVLSADRPSPLRARYYDEILPLIEVMCAAYAEQAVRSITVEQGAFLASSLVAQGKVEKRQEPFLLNLLDMLVDEEAIETTDEGMRWVADSGLPDPEMIWLRLLRDYPDHSAQIMLTGRAGRQLVDTLAGAVDGDGLVASWADGPLMDGFLRTAAALQRMDRIIGDLIDELNASLPAEGFLRLLLVVDRRTTLATRLLRELDLDHCEVVVVRNSEGSPDSLDDWLADTPMVRVIDWPFGRSINESLLTELAGFDIALLDNVLPAMADPEALLTAVRQSLRLGGLVAAVEQQPSRWSDFVLGLSPQWWHGGHHDQIPLGSSTAEDLQELVVAAGFESPAGIFDHSELEAGPCLIVARSPDPGAEVRSASKHSDTCVVVHQESGYSAALGSALESALGASGCKVIPVVCDPQKEAHASLYSLDTQLRESFTTLVQRLRDGGHAPDRIVWLAGLEPDAPREPNEAVWLQRQAKRCDDIGQFFTSLSKASLHPQCLVVTSGAFVAGTLVRNDEAVADPAGDSLVWGFGRCLINEVSDTKIRLVDLANPELFSAMADGLTAEALQPDGEDEIVLTEAGRMVGRVAVIDRESSGADVSSEDVEVVLDFETPGPLKGLGWKTRAGRDPDGHEVEIDVRAAGLNFRDVMYAMGLLSDEAVEAGFAGATLGMELSGVVRRVGAAVTDFKAGDEVIAFAPASFATRTITTASAVIAKPADWSFEAAATVPTTFFTVFYALQELARLRPGERVLIHGAAGGVGIAAIQLAQYLGAEIYATAGTPEKRDFVRQLGVSQVFDSRSLDFADEILEQTNGEGVDVVLNSLAGEAVRRNLRVLRPFGRFLELGKRDYYEDTRIGLRPFRNNISYFGIDADQLMSERPALTSRLFRELFGLFESGDLSPLPYRAFPADDVVDAFRFMQQSKQIGKVVLTFEQPPQPQSAQIERDEELRLEPAASYLITGGLGGFGAATARWLVSKGARHLALLSRRGDSSPEAAALVEELVQAGAEAHVFSCDVTDKAALADVLSGLQTTMPPLRGVIHAAMVIDDGLIRDLDASRIEAVFAPKVLGAMHLDALTRDAALDFFVLFSSATTTFGNPGQASYVAANRFLEHFAEQRRVDGLPALAVSWGPIEDAGYLARNRDVGEALENRLGGKALSAETALQTLERLLVEDRSGVAVLNFEWSRLKRALPAATSERFIALEALSSGEDELEEGDEVRQLILDMSDEDAVELLTDMIRHDVSQILRLDTDRIDVRRSMQSFGMDSLMAMELAVSVEKRLGVQLPVMLLGEGPSIMRLAEKLVAQMRLQPGHDNSRIRATDNVRAVAAVHGHEIVEDEKAVADFVGSLTSNNTK